MLLADDLLAKATSNTVAQPIVCANLDEPESPILLSQLSLQGTFPPSVSFHVHFWWFSSSKKYLLLCSLCVLYLMFKISTLGVDESFGRNGSCKWTSDNSSNSQPLLTAMDRRIADSEKKNRAGREKSFGQVLGSAAWAACVGNFRSAWLSCCVAVPWWLRKMCFLKVLAFCLLLF